MENDSPIRIKIKYVSVCGESAYFQFNLDPGVKSLKNLYDWIQSHLRTEEDLSVSYILRDKYGEHSRCLLQSDEDYLKALSVCSDMTLRLFIEAKPKSDEGWDLVDTDELASLEPGSLSAGAGTTETSVPPSVATYLSSTIRTAFWNGGFLQNVSQQLAKTVNSLEKVINSRTNLATPLLPPLSETEFRGYMDGMGRLVHRLKFYQNVYRRGLEPALRRVAWRILLNVFSPELNGRERMALLQSRMERYQSLSHSWKCAYRDGRLSKAQVNAIALVCVDVVRTDRSHPFYHSCGENQRISQLFNILATYAVYHPGIGYHQGMSNLASLLLYVQDSEGAAYVCLCALMQRLAPKFSPLHDQIAMITQMQHLHDLLVYTDYRMAQFLRLHGLANMFFTERWLLLELIREFPFDQALHLCEVQWAAIALTAASWPDVGSTQLGAQLAAEQNPILFEDVTMHYAHCDTNLINSLIGEQYVYENSSLQVVSTSGRLKLRQGNEGINPIQEGDPVHMKDWVVELPSPDALGGGSNPFLLFIGVAMIQEYAEDIYETVHDVCDLFHLYQTHNKRHNLAAILERARSLFDAYLKDQDAKRRSLMRAPVSGVNS